MSIVQGRDFTFSDNEQRPRVAIISRSLARQLFGEGRGPSEYVRISNRPELQKLQVVGVVSDARLFDVRRGNLAIAYLPALQNGRLAHFKFLVVRAPASAASEIQRAIESLGVETMQRTQTLAYARGRTLLQERVMAALGGYFGLLALMLVAAGVYGLLSYVLSLRRKELGIRMALGADSGLIGRTILSEGLRVAGVGLGIGLIATLLSVQALEIVLVATSPYDPIAVASACSVLLAVTALASVVPTVRAGRVEPLAELRRD